MSVQDSVGYRIVLKINLLYFSREILIIDVWWPIKTLIVKKGSLILKGKCFHF